MEARKCNSCGAAILWGKTESGKAMPLDAEPSEDGTIALMTDGRCRVLKGGDLDHARMAKIQLRKSHFATCPNSAQHRKAK